MKGLRERRMRGVEASFPCDSGERVTAGDCGGEIWARRALGVEGGVTVVM